MDLLLIDILGKPLWMWALFLCLVLVMLAFDLGVLQRRPHEIGVGESLALSAFYIVLALAFGVWIWFEHGEESSLEFFAGFVMEKSLAMDNIFVIAMIFAHLRIPRAHQHRVLVYGILGAVILRGIMIAGGASLVAHFEWILYVFAAFLVFTGLKLLFDTGHDYDVATNPVLRFMQRHLRITDRLCGHAFFVCRPRQPGGRAVVWATPLFLALVLVELADVVFAIDSIPAIFAVTLDPFIVFTSNIFAILGLRALYFALAAMIHRFAHLKYAMAAVLVLVGAKVVVTDLLDIEKVPAWLSLGCTVFVLFLGIAWSMWRTRRTAQGGVAVGPDAVHVARANVRASGR